MARENERQMHVYDCSHDWKEIMPQIRLQGKWLLQFGFKPGDQISVSCENDRLTISHEPNDN